MNIPTTPTNSNCNFRALFVYFVSVCTWRGAGAVELATLERWYTGNGIVGSNPTLSAQKPASGGLLNSDAMSAFRYWQFLFRTTTIS
jgi:hypothetical protein